VSATVARSPLPGEEVAHARRPGLRRQEPPSIALVPAGTSWEEIHDHIKIAHDFLLVQPEDGGYAGAYWTGTEMVVLDDLGPDQDEALDEFREQLNQRGEL
jgi:hypothetical protein